MKFTKMQGIGNDYVYVNCFQEHIENPSEVSRRISDRHFGIGSDGLILIKPSEKADFEMECIMLTEVRAQCAETECAVWENMCMTMVLQIKHVFLWIQRAVLSIWI